jgi:hypothetical protein
MQLLEQIEHYLETSNLAPSRFGRMVVGDPRFVGDLRSGRRPRAKTLKRVSAFLDQA